jgi:hypothetical protein
MKHYLWAGAFLLCWGQNGACVENTPEVSLRFHSQWKISEREKQALQQKYGTSRVLFDQNGYATPLDLSPEKAKRWRRLYDLCMSDGCTFCDWGEGSCENQTCGPQNAHCKPYMGPEGYPKCGIECADYAFMSTLI